MRYMVDIVNKEVVTLYVLGYWSIPHSRGGIITAGAIKKEKPFEIINPFSLQKGQKYFHPTFITGQSCVKHCSYVAAI